MPVPLGSPTLPGKGGQARAEYSPSQSPFPRPIENETALNSLLSRLTIDLRRASLDGYLGPTRPLVLPTLSTLPEVRLP